MKTDNISHYENYLSIFKDATDYQRNNKKVDLFTCDTESYFSEVTENKPLQITTLESLRKGNKTILEALAKEYQIDGNVTMSNFITSLELYISTHSLDLDIGSSDHKRLLDYVYPVV